VHLRESWRDDHFKFPTEHLFKQIAPSACTPEFEFGVVMHINAKHNQIRTQFRVHIVNDAASAPVEAIGDAQECGKLPEAFAVRVIQGGVARFGRFGVSAPMVTNQRGEKRDFGRIESTKFAVLDQIGGVPVMSLARNVLADVVQERRELEHLAVGRAQAVKFLHFVEATSG
jgi:hypothetical protein